MKGCVILMGTVSKKIRALEVIAAIGILVTVILRIFVTIKSEKDFEFYLSFIYSVIAPIILLTILLSRKYQSKLANISLLVAYILPQIIWFVQDVNSAIKYGLGYDNWLLKSIISKVAFIVATAFFLAAYMGKLKFPSRGIFLLISYVILAIDFVLSLLGSGSTDI